MSTDTQKPRSFEYDTEVTSLDPSELTEGDILVIATENEQVYEFNVIKNAENGLTVKCSVRGKDKTGTIYNTTIQLGAKLTTNFPYPLAISSPIAKIVVSNPDAETKIPLNEPTTAKFIRIQVAEVMESGETNKAGETIAIGDSNGDYKTYIWNLKHARNLEHSGLINSSGNWIGGKIKAVIHGDILADRATEGFKILAKNKELREEAQRHGGDIILLAGNHDDFMFSFLLDRCGIHDDGIDACLTGGQGEGLLELTMFSGDRQMRKPLYVQGEDGNLTYDEVKNILVRKALGQSITTNESQQIDAIIAKMKAKGGRLNREEILKNMRSDKYGRMLLNEMCGMKLCEQIEDTLYIHSDPTDEMLTMILNVGVNAINGDFQTAMRGTLIEGNEFNTGYNKVFDTFLSTNNRSFARARDRSGTLHIAQIRLRHDLIKRIKEEMGINRVVFGHSDLGKGQRIIEIKGVQFINVDQSALKGGKQTISAAAIPRAGRKSGRVITGTEMFNLNLSPPPSA